MEASVKRSGCRVVSTTSGFLRTGFSGMGMVEMVGFAASWGI